jgi:ABC-2 type transport system permease protein
MLLLLLFGWSLSAINIAVLFLFGSKAQAFSWIVIAFVAPFSAIYYSVAALPEWARVFGALLPSSYAFEAARQVFTAAQFDTAPLLMGYGLAMTYLVGAFLLLRWSIYFSLQRGLFKNK